MDNAKIKFREFKSDGKHIAAYFVYCPACRRSHRFIVKNEADADHTWGFNGDFEKPTFSPSLLVECGPIRLGEDGHICHSFLEDGVWQFLGDCTHEMADSRVPMIDFPANFKV